MAEPISARSPLSGIAAEIAAASVYGVVALREVAVAEQFSLRGNAADGEFATAAGAALGFELPTSPNTVRAGNGCEALWLGPDEWLLVRHSDGEPLAGRLQPALNGRHAALVDVSAARVIFEVEGPKAGEVLAKGCSLDLHPRAFAPRQCAQTLLARIPVILEQTDQAPTFRIYVRPSFARFLASWLVDAMREYRTEA